MQNDPWKHRSAGMTCATCMWCVMKASTNGYAKLGRCRRRAPTMSGYPAVFPTDWCGDHKLDENKLPETEAPSAARVYPEAYTPPESTVQDHGAGAAARAAEKARTA